MQNPEWFELARQAEQFYDRNEFDDALRLADQSIALNPQFAFSHQVRGLVLSNRGDTVAAMESLETALKIRPDLAISHNVLGLSYNDLGDLENAIRHYDSALFLTPNNQYARFNRGLAQLKLGNFADGWREYEWRWSGGQVQGPQIPVPRWTGGPLAGRSILVHTEQGMGDVLMFMRFLPMVKRKCEHLVFACQKALQNLLRPTACVDSWFPIDEPSDINFDVYTPLLSLPWLLNIDEKKIPCPVPYVFADPVRIQKWNQLLGDAPGFKVGLGWQGSPTYKGDKLRSIPLSQYAPLAKIPGVKFYSLQKGPGEEQIAPNRDAIPVEVIPNLDNDATFVDTAAILQKLDLVITSDSSLAHLAGAMGRPVWVMLSTGCDWRWAPAGENSIWYPTLRMFRQKKLGDWPGVFEEVAAALAEAVTRGGPVTAPVLQPNTVLTLPASTGELLDKITILEIKRARIADSSKIANVTCELDQLNAVARKTLVESAELTRLLQQLKEVNEQLWVIEDDIRICEHAQDFGPKFIELARSVYQCNDRRSAIKRQINELMGSAIVEEKSYA